MCALMVATASTSFAESQPSPPRTAGRAPQPQATPSPPPPRSPPKAQAAPQRETDQHRQLAACFEGAVQRITMIVTVAYDGTKLRSTVKQSQRSTKQIDACVVDVLDRITVRFPPRPVTIELPVEYTPPPAGTGDQGPGRTAASRI